MRGPLSCALTHPSPSSTQPEAVPTSYSIRVLVVDDHPSVREGLAEMISAEADMTVVGTARDGAEAVALFGQLRPDVTVIDLRLPKLGGIEAIRAARRTSPGGRFIVMTSFAGDQGAWEAVRAGASAFVFKEAFGDELLAAIRAVHAGAEFFPSGHRTPNQS
jgi:DNA-binding NarL/FixJ family response regulator